MTRDFSITAPADSISPVDFLRALQGKPPVTEADRAEKKRKAEEFLVKRREENRREIEELRDRLCKLASPKLAAEWRARWAREDAERDAREERRRAAA